MRPTPRLLFMAIAALTLIGAFVATTAIGAISRSDGTYTLDLSLSKPSTLRPADGSTLQYPTDPIKIAWRPVPGASKYDVQIAQQPSSNTNCNTVQAWQVENILFTHTTSELGWVPELTDKAHGSDIWTGSFCWRVRASGTTPGTWSTSSKFSISWPAKATDLKFFADESGDIPRAAGTATETTGFDTGYLEWSEISGASRYEIQISEAPTFSTQALFASKIYPGTRLLLPQMPDNNYSWRVRPIAGNGVRGTWSDIATFTIQRDTRYWTSDSASLYPANDATIDDLRIGWEPVPGASYYRYMAAISPTIFTELDNNDPYGVMDSDCNWGNSRISSKEEKYSSTINSWVTTGGIFDPEVIKNLYTWCQIDPDPQVDGDETYVRPPIPSAIYWRVYPVWQVSDANESGWVVPDRKVVGSAVQRKLNLAPYGAGATTDPTIGVVDEDLCKGSVVQDCLRHIGGAMSPKNSSIHSSTMQVPYFQFGAFPGTQSGAPFFNGAGPGGFRVQIARDSNFNNQVLPPAANNLIRGWMATVGPERFDERASTSVGQTRFGQFTRSFALTTGLPDEGQDGNGYFWRSIPCQSSDSFTSGPFLCVDRYSDQTESIWSPGMQFGHPASGAIEFRKRVEVSTAVISNFSAGMPMLKVGPVGASSFADWQKGIIGADHYEFELARNQAFDDSKVLKTTVPRIVPWGASVDSLLEPGTWFWRVRAVDRDDLTGTWSAASSFSIAPPSPTVLSSSDTLGVGATVEWNHVAGATQYEIAWATDEGFGDATTAKTRQTAYYIPSSKPGAYFWRVRAQIAGEATEGPDDDSFGAWTTPREVTILAASHIPFGVSAKIVSAGGYAIIEGQLVIAGTARNGQRVTLERKSGACDASGSYATYGNGTTGDRIDDGIVRFRVRAMNSRCYRLAWQYATGTLYSAAFEVGARPVVKFTPLQRRVKRGREFCSIVRSNVPVTGRIQVQYKLGRTWVTAKTANVRNMRSRRQCAAINRGGVFPVRLFVDRMANLEDTSAGGGSVKTADSFQIIRHRR